MIEKFTVLPATVVLAIAPAAAAFAEEQAIYACTRPDGSVELSEVPNEGHCEQVVAGPPPATTSTPEAAVGPAPDAEAGRGPGPRGPAEASPTPPGEGGADPASPEAPRSQVPDTTVPGAANADGLPPSVANRAANRRFLMRNRAAAQQLPGLGQ